jgi:hypothetical protein
MGVHVLKYAVEYAFETTKFDMLEVLVDTGCSIPGYVISAIDTLPTKLAEKIKQKAQATEEPYDSDCY